MKQVFGGINAMEAHVVSHLLEQHGIATNMTGHFLGSASGELPATNLNSVWIVNDDDYDRARELIKGWEEEQPLAPKPEGKALHRKPSFIPGWFIGLLIGLSISYAYFQAPAITDEYDNNSDGKPDAFYIYSAHGMLKRTRLDTNFDGVIDIIQYHNNDGLVISDKTDANHDGHFETQNTYKYGNISSSKIDQNNDGIIERTLIFDKSGNLRTLQFRDENTGKVVKVTDYEMGIMTSARMDTDGDGKMDVSYTYDKYEEIRTKTPIKDTSME